MLKISPKIYKSIPLASAVLLLSYSVAVATVNNTTQNRVQIRQDAVENKQIIQKQVQENQEIRQEKREKIRTQVKKNIEQRQQTREERRAGLAQGHADRLSTRFSAYYNRLTNIMDKMATRYGMMSDNGKNMTTAIAKLTDASTKLKAAKLAGEQAITKFSSMPTDKLEVQLVTAKDAKTFAQEARKTYKEAVTLFKESIQLAKQAANQ